MDWKGVLEAELAEQWRRHPEGFPCTRDGLRLGIAAIEDETKEVWEAWREEVRRLKRVSWDSPNWSDMEKEIIQVAGNAIRLWMTISSKAPYRHPNGLPCWKKECKVRVLGDDG